MSSENVLIVGGGLSGLSTAYYLSQQGIRSVILEKSGRLGGLIKTDRIDGCELEAGPDSFISTKPQVSELATELDVSEKLMGSNDKERRVFVVRDGKLVAFPKGMSMMVPGEWGPALKADLWSAPTKLRLLSETLMRPRRRERDFSVGELVTDHFGPEMLEYVAEPLLCGVYGGEAGLLSANSVLPRFVGYEERYGSLIKGVRKSEVKKPGEKKRSLFQSFEGGMQALTDAIAKASAKDTSTVYADANRVDKTETGWRVRFGAESISCAHLVLACPAHISATLLQGSAPELAGELGDIPYSSAVLAMLVFDREQLGHALNGFGFLIPRGERKTIAAATWVNTKFPSRIRPGLAALRAFIVGKQAADMIAQGMSNESVVALVLQDFQRLMGIRSAPVFSTVYFWPKSMPQYVVGHAERVQRIEMETAKLPGLHLAGNIFDGVGLPDCVRRAKDVAKHIGDHRV